MKKGFTMIQLLIITVIFLIIFWLIVLITGGTKNIECYMTTKGLICNYGKLGE